MNQPKIIFCPKCKRKVATYDGKSTIDVISRCYKCNKRVIYHIETGVTELKKRPPRNCSSGISFY